jgi:haloalkane dehalogenase
VCSSDLATLKEVEANLDRLKHLPVTIFWGEKDWCFTPYFREQFERRFPGAEVHRYEDCGHYVVEDAIDRIRPRVVELCPP